MLLIARKNFFLIALLILSVLNVNTVCAETRMPVYVYPDIREHTGNLKFTRFESDNTALKFAYVNDPAYIDVNDPDYIYEAKRNPVFFVKSKNRCRRVFSSVVGSFSEPKMPFLGTLILDLEEIKTNPDSKEDMKPMNNIINCGYYFEDMLSGKKMVLRKKYNLETINAVKRDEGMYQSMLSLDALSRDISDSDQ